MPIPVRANEGALEALATAPDKGHKIVFVGGVCPQNPHKSVRIQTGGPFKIDVYYPGLEEDLGNAREPGLVYYVVWSQRYPGVGVAQASVRYPFMLPDAPIFEMSMRILANQCVGTPVDVFIPNGIGGGAFVKAVEQLIPKWPDWSGITIWTGKLG